MRSIRRAAAVLLGACALAVPYWSTGIAHAATATKTFTGKRVDTGRWGEVQVKITVRRTTTTSATTKKKAVKRRITAVTVPVKPADSPRTIFIGDQAFPTLIKEALKAQSGSIDLVSGATGTSQAFAESLQSAIVKAKKW